MTPPEQKIDIHNSARAWENASRNLDADPGLCEENKAALKEFLRYARLGRLGSGAGDRKLIKYEYVIRTVNRQLGNKPFRTISKERYEVWYEALTQGRILNRNKRRYSYESARDLVKDFKIFLKWYDDGAHYGKIAWFKVKGKPTNKPAFTIEEVRRVLKATPDIETRFYIALAFDSGARPEEMANCRRKDMVWIEKPGTGAESSYWLDIRYSKNDQQPRKIPVPLFTDIYNEYLSKYEKHLKSNDSLLVYHYHSYIRNLKALEKAVKDKLTHYKLRHSSWTYWGSKIRDKYALNKRMGEHLSSTMADRYIDPSKLETHDEILESRRDDVTRIKQELAEMQKKAEEQQRIIDELVQSKINAALKKAGLRIVR